MWPFKKKRNKTFNIPLNIPVISQIIDPDRNINIMIVRPEDFELYESNPLHDEFGMILGEYLVLSKKSKCKNVIFR